MHWLRPYPHQDTDPIRHDGLHYLNARPSPDSLHNNETFINLRQQIAVCSPGRQFLAPSTIKNIHQFTVTDRHVCSPGKPSLDPFTTMKHQSIHRGDRLRSQFHGATTSQEYTLHARYGSATTWPGRMYNAFIQYAGVTRFIMQEVKNKWYPSPNPR